MKHPIPTLWSKIYSTVADTNELFEQHITSASFVRRLVIGSILTVMVGSLLLSAGVLHWFTTPQVKAVTQTFSVTSGADDGYWTGVGFNNSLLSIAIGDSNGFMRFSNVTIPQGATITSAHVELIGYNNFPDANVDTRIYANDIDNASAPTTRAEAESASLTTASVAWNDLPIWSSGLVVDTPDISDVIQEVVDRSGWISGNAMMVLLIDNGSTANNNRYATAYEDTKTEPQLVVTYTEPEDEGGSSTDAAKVAWLTGTQLADSSTKINISTKTALSWNTSQDIDTDYYSYSATNPSRLTIETAGDYLVGVNLPATSNSSDTAVRSGYEIDVRVNGAKQDVGVGRSTYIRNSTTHSQSSAHLNVMLKDLAISDYIEVFVAATTTGDTNTVTSDTHTLYAEYVTDQTIFAATGTQSTNSTNLNQSTAYGIEWDSELRKDTGYTHSTVSNPEAIGVPDTGNYLVMVNIPLSGSVARGNVRGDILQGKRGVSWAQADGGVMSQGYIRDANGHTTASLHWSGVVALTTSFPDILVSVQQEAVAGTITVGGEKATIYIQKLPTTGLYQAEATQLQGGSNDWNPATQTPIAWATDNITDANIYTHSTSSNNQQITVKEDGDYELAFNAAFSIVSGSRSGPNAKVQVNGVDVPGFEGKSTYIRNTSDHTESSATMMGLLNNLSADDIITITMQAEGNGSVLDDSTPATLLIWKKDPPPASEATSFTITIDHTKVAANLTDFPVYVDLSDMPASFWDTVSSSGGDIRMYESDGTTEIPREVVAIDTGTKTGELHFKGDLSSTSDTSFILTIDGTSSDYAADATYGAENVWDADFAAVYHLNDENAIDSTANGKDGTVQGGMSSSNIVDGKVGKALNFDGSDDYISLPFIINPSTTPLSATLFGSIDTDLSSNGTALQQNGTSGRSWIYRFATDPNPFSTYLGGSRTDSNTAIAPTTWYSLGMTYASGTVQLYTNGSPDSSKAETPESETDTFIIGSGKGSAFWDGQIDEVRISSTNRSANWISTEYNNQNSPSTFYTATSQTASTPTMDELIGGGNWWHDGVRQFLHLD